MGGNLMSGVEAVRAVQYATSCATGYKKDGFCMASLLLSLLCWLHGSPDCTQKKESSRKLPSSMHEPHGTF